MLLAFGLAGSLSRPLTRLAAAAKRLGVGDLSARAGEVGGGTEVEELGHSFDEMADRLERSVQAQREFVANASHQLRTPLTAMKLRLEARSRTRRTTSSRRGSKPRTGRSIASPASSTVCWSWPGRSRKADRPRSISERRWTEPWHAGTSAGDRDSTVVSRGDCGSASVDPTDLDQILDNLLDNATAYAPGEVTIESGGLNGRLFVAVQDQGPGIAWDDLARVTERFYRGRGAPSGGSGLGLAIARQLAEKWGGTLSVESIGGEGTRVEVRLDAAP